MPWFVLDKSEERTYKEGMTTKEVLRKHYQRLGHLGGTARAKNLTPAQRTEQARHAVTVRWEKYRIASHPEPDHAA